MFLSIGTGHFASRDKVMIASFNSESFVSVGEHARHLYGCLCSAILKFLISDSKNTKGKCFQRKECKC